MSVEHVFYIPMCVILGLVLGFVWGRRAALAEIEAKDRLAEEHEQTRAERRERRSSKP